jgi:predicted nucleic acid-binding Zn ribbon protein
MKVQTERDFGTRECPSCSCDIPANHNRCPICRYHFPVATPRQKATRLWGALIMLILLLGMLLIGLL